MSAFPVVVRDDASASFFDAAGRGELLVQRCQACDTVVSPEVRTCPGCGDVDLTGHVAAGLATLISWVVVHHPPVPVLADAVHYLSGIVELDEGPWLIVRLVDLESPTVGRPLRVRFVHPETSEALPVFGPAT